MAIVDKTGDAGIYSTFIKRCLYIDQREPTYQNPENAKGSRRQYLRKRRGKKVPINQIGKIQTNITKFIRIKRL
jgi:hypothetical protein